MPVKTTQAKDSSPLLKALQAFAEELTAKYEKRGLDAKTGTVPGRGSGRCGLSPLSHGASDGVPAFHGEPEDQLRPAVSNLFRDYARIMGRDLTIIGEVPLHDRLGQPDFCLYAGPLPIGFVELKAPGKGVHLKNLYNLYVYFLGWAFWKVFEHASAPVPASSPSSRPSSLSPGRFAFLVPAACPLSYFLILTSYLCPSAWAARAGAPAKRKTSSPFMGERTGCRRVGHE